MTGRGWDSGPAGVHSPCSRETASPGPAGQCPEAVVSSLPGSKLHFLAAGRMGHLQSRWVLTSVSGPREESRPEGLPPVSCFKQQPNKK